MEEFLLIKALSFYSKSNVKIRGGNLRKIMVINNHESEGQNIYEA